MRCMRRSKEVVAHVPARVHTPRSNNYGRPPIPVMAELDTLDNAPAQHAASPSASDSAAVSASAVRQPDLVVRVASGAMEATSFATTSAELPKPSDLRTVADLGPYLTECLLLLRCDFPILALRRLLELDKIAVAAGLPSLRTSADRRAVEVLS
jgi:hypothetical protein